MIPNLFEATKKYWRKLDELELAYERGEVSIEEVDARVESLMSELGRERRASWAYIRHSLSSLWNERRETILGVAFLAIVTYAWAVFP